MIRLRDVEGWSSDEVRNALDITEVNQRVLLHRARAKVRQALEDVPGPRMTTTDTQALSCQELVELVTDYLEGALEPADQQRFDAHIAGCNGCTRYLEQLRQTIRLTGTITTDDLTPEAERALLAAFSDWASSEGRAVVEGDLPDEQRRRLEAARTSRSCSARRRSTTRRSHGASRLPAARLRHRGIR